MNKFSGLKLGAIISYVIFSLSGAILATLGLSIFVFQLFIEPLKLTAITGLTVAQLKQTYSEMIQFLIKPGMQKFSLTFFSSSPQGQEHFADVKLLIFATIVIFIMSTICVGIFSGKIRKKRQTRKMEVHFNMAAILPLILMFIGILTFDKIFITFHQIFFQNDYWIFDPLLDPVINILPQVFFMVLFLIVIIVYEIILLFLRWIIKK